MLSDTINSGFFGMPQTPLPSTLKPEHPQVIDTEKGL